MQPAPPVRSKTLWQRLLLVIAVALAAMLVLGVLRAGLAAGGPEFHATTYDPPAQAADFTLTDHNGAAASLADFRGSPVLLFFGYTHCPDVCPLTLSALREALDAAGAEARDARVLLVTVDPERDTPEVLARYVRNFGPQVVGLTGSETQLRKVLSDYGIHAEPHAEQPGMLGHTSAVFGIDGGGMIRVLLRPDNPREELREDVRTLVEL